MQDLSFEERLERLQIAFANVGNGPVVEVGVSPMDQVVTFTRDDLLRFAAPDVVGQINRLIKCLRLW